jgi:ParB/RepB/Spo0J family partition protein
MAKKERTQDQFASESAAQSPLDKGSDEVKRSAKGGKEQLLTLKPKDIHALQYDNYRQIDESKVEEYFQSIREVGVKVAVLVKKTDKGMFLIDGHHRVEAARRLMQQYPHISITIQAIVRIGTSESDEIVQKVVSNFTRRESIVDRAAGYSLLAEKGKTAKQIADTVGKDRTTIENHLHFYAMYLRHKEAIDKNLPSLKEAFLYKLGHKFNRDPDSDIAGQIEKEVAPKERKSATKVDPESILLDAGFSKTDAKKVCSVLREAGIRL